MYGVQHRVAPLRRGQTQLSETTYTNTTCHNPISSQHSSTADIHTQRNSHIHLTGPIPTTSNTNININTNMRSLKTSKTTTTTNGGYSYGYALPTSMQRSQLTIPHTQTSPLLQLQQQQQEQQLQQKETTTALLNLVESFQHHEKYLASGSESLTHLTSIVNGQHAQIAALHGIAEEMRSMTGAIRDAVALLRPTIQIKEEKEEIKQQQRGEEKDNIEVIPLSHSTTVVLPTDAAAVSIHNNNHNNYHNNNNNGYCMNSGIQASVKRDKVCAWQSAAAATSTFLLGADSPSMTPHNLESIIIENDENMNSDYYQCEAAAYVCSSQLKPVMLKSGEETIWTGVKRTAYVEDDVFSM